MKLFKSLFLLTLSFSLSAAPIFIEGIQEQGRDFFALSSELDSSQKHSDGLVYGDYETFFQLGEVVFTRAAGKWNGRTSEYDVIVYNNYGFDVCLVPSFEFIKNSREDFYEPSFILPPNSRIELGHYGAIRFGSSWHVKWNYFISTNLEYCAI